MILINGPVETSSSKDDFPPCIACGQVKTMTDGWRIFVRCDCGNYYGEDGCRTNWQLRRDWKIKQGIPCGPHGEKPKTDDAIQP